MSALSLRPVIDAIEEIKMAFCFNDPRRGSLTGANALRWKRGFFLAPWPENATKADEVLNAAPEKLRRVFADAARQAPDSRLSDLHLEAYRLVTFDPPLANDVEGEFVRRADALIDALEIHEQHLRARSPNAAAKKPVEPERVAAILRIMGAGVDDLRPKHWYLRFGLDPDRICKLMNKRPPELTGEKKPANAGRGPLTWWVTAGSVASHPDCAQDIERHTRSVNASQCVPDAKDAGNPLVRGGAVVSIAPHGRRIPASPR